MVVAHGWKSLNFPITCDKTLCLSSDHNLFCLMLKHKVMSNSNQVQIKTLEDGRIDYNAEPLRTQIETLISFGYDHSQMLSALVYFMGEQLQSPSYLEGSKEERKMLSSGVQSIRSMSDRSRELAKLLKL